MKNGRLRVMKFALCAPAREMRRSAIHGIGFPLVDEPLGKS